MDQFLLCMNEEDIFDNFPGIGNVIASDVGRAVSYHETLQKTFIKVYWIRHTFEVERDSL